MLMLEGLSNDHTSGEALSISDPMTYEIHLSAKWNEQALLPYVSQR